MLCARDEHWVKIMHYAVLLTGSKCVCVCHSVAGIKSRSFRIAIFVVVIVWLLLYYLCRCTFFLPEFWLIFSCFFCFGENKRSGIALRSAIFVSISISKKKRFERKNNMIMLKSEKMIILNPCAF